MEREAAWPARRRRVDRRGQLLRDARPSARRVDSVVVLDLPWWLLLRTRLPARLPNARRAARRVRLLGLAAVARRVALGRPHLAGTPLRTRARTGDHLPARAAGVPSRAQIQAGGQGVLDGLDADYVKSSTTIDRAPGDLALTPDRQRGGRPLLPSRDMPRHDRLRPGRSIQMLVGAHSMASCRRPITRSDEYLSTTRTSVKPASVNSAASPQGHGAERPRPRG